MLALYGFSLGDGKTELLPSDGATDHPIVRVFYIASAIGFILLINFIHCGCTSAP